MNIGVKILTEQIKERMIDCLGVDHIVELSNNKAVVRDIDENIFIGFEGGCLYLTSKEAWELYRVLE